MFGGFVNSGFGGNGPKIGPRSFPVLRMGNDVFAAREFKYGFPIYDQHIGSIRPSETPGIDGGENVYSLDKRVGTLHEILGFPRVTHLKKW